MSELPPPHGLIPSTCSVKKKIKTHGLYVKLICVRNTAVSRVVATCKIKNFMEMSKTKIHVYLQQKRRNIFLSIHLPHKKIL